MNDARTRPGLKVNTGIKAAGLQAQHNRRPAGVKIASGVKAAGITVQHNRRLGVIR